MYAYPAKTLTHQVTPRWLESLQHDTDGFLTTWLQQNKLKQTKTNRHTHFTIQLIIVLIPRVIFSQDSTVTDLFIGSSTKNKK